MTLPYLDFINIIYKAFQELQVGFIDLTHAFENEDTQTFKELEINGELKIKLMVQDPEF